MAEERGGPGNATTRLTLFYWGGRCAYCDLFRNGSLPGNVLTACYFEDKTSEQLRNQLGVPDDELEGALEKLTEYGLVRKTGPAYRSGIVIVTGKELGAIGRYNAADLARTADRIRAFAGGYMFGLRELGFYGCGMPAGHLRWMLVSLILRRAYVELLQSEVSLDYPTDCFGERCFRFLMELPKDDPYFMGVSAYDTKNGAVYMWDVPLNGEALHPLVSPERAEMLAALPVRKSVSESEKRVCTELLDLGLARWEGDRILPAFPYLNTQQGRELKSRIEPIAREICEGAKERLEGISCIMREYAPEHLADEAAKLPALIALQEAAEVMRMLCKGRWLTAMEDCLATTVAIGNQ